MATSKTTLADLAMAVNTLAERMKPVCEKVDEMHRNLTGKDGIQVQIALIRAEVDQVQSNRKLIVTAILAVAGSVAASWLLMNGGQ
jgi:hypothetical protein